jgi:hypothetical protein
VPALLIAPGADGDVHWLAPPLEVQSLAQVEELLAAVLARVRRLTPTIRN